MKDLKKVWKHYIINTKENMSFYNWLTNYFETMSAIYIINKITESEIMQIIWNKEQEKKYNIKTILESNFFDTRDNARYSLEKFLERQKENPNLDTLIIVNEWPYLLRAVLTTRKIAKDMGIIGIKIIGYPANYSKNEEWYYDSIELFRTDKVSGTIENIRKLIEYDDSTSFIIDKFIDSNKLYPGGPNITIGKDNISLIEAINNKIKKRIVTFN